MPKLLEWQRSQAEGGMLIPDHSCEDPLSPRQEHLNGLLRHLDTSLDNANPSLFALSKY